MWSFFKFTQYKLLEVFYSILFGKYFVQDKIQDSNKLKQCYDNCLSLLGADLAGFRFSDCECPTACGATSYETELSYAALSTLSVNSLLDKDKAYLISKYHHALEIEQVDDYNCNCGMSVVFSQKQEFCA